MSNNHSSEPLPLVSRAATGLMGRIRVPGDKSMSHRALMFGGVAIGVWLAILIFRAIASGALHLF